MGWKTRGEVLKEIATKRTDEGTSRKTIGALIAVAGLIGGFLGFPHNETLSLGVGGLVFGIGATMVMWGHRDFDEGDKLSMAVDKAEEMGILKPE